MLLQSRSLRNESPCLKTSLGLQCRVESICSRHLVAATCRRPQNVAATKAAKAPKALTHCNDVISPSSLLLAPMRSLVQHTPISARGERGASNFRIPGENVEA